MAEYHEVSIESIEAALAYAAAHRDEIEAAIADYKAITSEDLKALLQNIGLTMI